MVSILHQNEYTYVLIYLRGNERPLILNDNNLKTSNPLKSLLKETNIYNGIIITPAIVDYVERSRVNK